MQRVKCKNQEVTVVCIPRDGDCLFSAIAHQLLGGNPLSPQHKVNTNKLRHEIAKELEKNHHKYQDQIYSNIWEIQEERMDRGGTSIGLNISDMVEYCNKIKTPGFWGGAESIIAVMQLYKTNVDIYMEEGETVTLNAKESTDRKIKLVYRKGARGYNHYDSFADEKANESLTNLQMEEDNPKQIMIENIQIAQGVGFNVQTNENKVTRQRKESNNLKIATWNVRGCAHPQKKEEIDEALDSNYIDIASLQETHVGTGNVETENFIWWTAGNKESREHRGVAILINKKSKLAIVNFKETSESICSAKIKWGDKVFIVMTAHLSSENDIRRKIQLSDLSKTIAGLHGKYHLILLGDLNAHFGREDRGVEEDKWIGPRVGHEQTNENGRYLKTLIRIYDLTLHNSWSQRNTVLTTWTNGHTSSQLDHILSTLKKMGIGCVNAKWIRSVKTDHKLLSAVIRNEQIDIGGRNVESDVGRKKRWQVKALDTEETNQNYKWEIKVALEEMDMQTKHPKSIKGDWEGIKEVITEAASTILTEPRSPMTPNRRKGIANQKKARFRREKFQSEKYKQELKIANKQRKEADKQHFINKCVKFTQNLKKLHPHQRLKELYNLTKIYKQEQRSKPSYIPMHKWEELLHGEAGAITETIEETDNKPLPPPPSKNFIEYWIKAGKRGKAPGIDNLNLELLKNAPPQLINEITRILRMAWEENLIPAEWKTSIQIPIPKIKNPKLTNDYRRISLCSVMYKLYAKHILHCLDNILPETPTYQAAFLPERATDDHIFTVGRVMEERWKGGEKTYILALDLEKAFDSVTHQAIIATLKHKGVPHKLINRVIRSCLNENARIQWFGQRSQGIDKGVGVKQGCPLSPRLFNEVINEVLQTAAEVLPYLDLDQKGHISLPLILVFADDIIIISESIQRLQEILNELGQLFLSVGLKINMGKSKLLIRDPNQIVTSDETLTLGNQKIETVESLKYLGIYLTNTLNRRKNVREKIKKAYMAAHSIYPFLQKHHLPWHLTKILYESTIVPIVTYGLKTTVLTKAIRTKLRDMERDIVKLLASTCKPKPKPTNINTLLCKRTIMRKITLLRIRYWGHIIRRPEDHLIKSAYRFRARKHKIERPCFTWKTCLEPDQKKYDTQGKDWTSILLNREVTAEISKEIFQVTDRSDSESSSDLEKREEGLNEKMMESE